MLLTIMLFEFLEIEILSNIIYSIVIGHNILIFFKILYWNFRDLLFIGQKLDKKIIFSY